MASEVLSLLGWEQAEDSFILNIDYPPTEYPLALSENSVTTRSTHPSERNLGAVSHANLLSPRLACKVEFLSGSIFTHLHFLLEACSARIQVFPNLSAFATRTYKGGN